MKKVILLLALFCVMICNNATASDVNNSSSAPESQQSRATQIYEKNMTVYFGGADSKTFTISVGSSSDRIVQFRQGFTEDHLGLGSFSGNSVTLTITKKMVPVSGTIVYCEVDAVSSSGSYYGNKVWVQVFH